MNHIVEGSGVGPALSIEGLSKAYREGDRLHVVLENVDVRIERGERVAILGPSGSGKSTVLNLVSGIDVPDRGRILIDGRSIVDLSERDRTLFRRDHIGFVFQAFNLLPTLTVIENLLLPLELKGDVTAEDRARARELLDRVGLADRADGFPDRLSGGEQQRVAVARALVHRPTLVLADEPTGNLDEETADTISDLLTEITKDDERALIVVTHSIDLAGRMDRILRLTHRRLVEEQPA